MKIIYLTRKRGKIITWKFAKEAYKLIGEKPILQIIGANAEIFIRLLAGRMVLFYKRKGSIHRIGSIKPHLNLDAKLKEGRGKVRISMMNGTVVFAAIELEKKMPFTMLKITDNTDLVLQLEISKS